MSGNLRMVDERVRMALRGSETFRGVVETTPVARVVSVRVGGGLLPAIVPALPVPLAPGDVVELERPRGVTGSLHVVRVLGR
jgi:hypothetical protein